MIGGTKMKILKSNIENIESEKKLIYMMTKGTRTAFKDLTDEDLDQAWPVDGYLIYEDNSSDGSTVNAMISILSGNRIIGGQSKPFIESFKEIIDIMENDPITIHVHKRVSKNNRSYYTATLDY